MGQGKFGNFGNTKGSRVQFNIQENSDIIYMENSEKMLKQQKIEKAKELYEFLKNHNWSPPKNYVGGREYKNRTHLLPNGHTYKEFDIFPHTKKRNNDRMVVSDNGEVYITFDHYDSFEKII